jgi:hypothetical protein
MLAVGRDVEQGSYSALYAATSPEVEEKGWNRYYFANPGKAGKERSRASDSELGRRQGQFSQDIIKEKLGDDALFDWNSASATAWKMGYLDHWGLWSPSEGCLNQWC